MDNQRSSRVTYDMPQEQLSYFDTRAKSSQSNHPSTTSRTLSEKKELANSRELFQRAEQQAPQLYQEKAGDELKSSVQKGTLSDHYRHFFAGTPRDASAPHPSNLESAAASTRSQNPVSREQPAKANYAVQKPVVLQVRKDATPLNAWLSSQVESERPAHQGPASQQRNVDNGTESKSQNEAQADGVYWSHNAPSVASQRSVTNEPREPTLPSSSATHENRRRGVPEEHLPPTPQNDYAQPRGDRQAPVRKSSISRGTPMSHESRSYRSESAASIDGSEPPQRVQRAYIPRQAEAIPPVRQSAVHQPQKNQVSEQPQQKAQPRETHSQRSIPEEKDEVAGQIWDEEKNCTFQPQVNSMSQGRDNNFRDSPIRSSEGTNAPRDSRGDYDQAPFDKLHGDAETARRAHDSRRMQRKAEEAELEINEKYGPRATAVNPRRSAMERDPKQEEVFSRLYADAQRYNREKTEQERFLEQKRQEERGEAPFDWNKGKDQKAGATEDALMSGDEKSGPQRRRSVSQQKPPKNMEVFVRLARPNSVTLSFQKQKELQEKERQEKEQRELEQKTTEMEKTAGYNWGIPAKSYTFADLESQNAMYVS